MLVCNIFVGINSHDFGLVPVPFDIPQKPDDAKDSQ